MSEIEKAINCLSTFIKTLEHYEAQEEETKAMKIAVQALQEKLEREKHPDGWRPFVLKYDEDEKIDMLQCELPDDEQVILVTNGRSVWEDMFLNDGEECYLDSGFIIVDEIIAWQLMPKAYKPKHIGEATNMVEGGEKCSTISEKLNSNTKMQ